MASVSRRAQRKKEPSRGDLRERRILEAAERLLDRDGFDAITMDAIAKEVGIARSALYFYFDSKQSVATALVEAIYEELAAPVREQAVSADPREVIDEAIEMVAELWRRHTAVLCYAAQRSSDVPRIGELWELTMDRWLAASLALFQAEPGSVANSAHARALISMVERSLWRFYAKPHSPAEEKELLHALKDILRVSLRGLSVDQGSGGTLKM